MTMTATPTRASIAPPRWAAAAATAGLLAASAGLAALIWTGRGDAAADRNDHDEATWRLTFADEFDGSALDASKWTPGDPFGKVRNAELQAYVPEAIAVRDGRLRISAERRPASYGGAERAFASGMVTTAGKFSQPYGRFECRARVPAGRGLWPAFWMLPDGPPRWPPEIDVFEVIGHDPRTVHFTHHWHRDPLARVRDADGFAHLGPDFSRDFHVFEADWTPDRIVWRVDGVEKFRSTRSVPRDVSMFLLLNLAVGGTWPGDPDDTTRFPATLEVDYVRVYERAE